ncbi:Type II inositol 1,4,5-trisphosphate 5-phosphatase [Frankliniella fusca]|uniref:Type II inositol 1,4,5-trisphosphate 5-phosphatase n=1 Tax=Frankliniella fusca TaxID=407009 RepID=A0AAE1GRM3_9NEOP|nr:Type II inositol 1,4,5-trisphosphate 5-phosphatase [Frankliniella fusca]
MPSIVNERSSDKSCGCGLERCYIGVDLKWKHLNRVLSMSKQVIPLPLILNGVWFLNVPSCISSSIHGACIYQVPITDLSLLCLEKSCWLPTSQTDKFKEKCDNFVCEQ